MLCVWQWEVCKYTGALQGWGHCAPGGAALQWGGQPAFSLGHRFACHCGVMQLRRIKLRKNPFLQWSEVVFWDNFSSHPGGSICNPLGERAPSHQAGDVCTAVCKDDCSSGAEIPLQAFLLICLSLVLVLGVLYVVCFWGFLLFYHNKVLPSLSTPFPATSLKFNTTKHSQTSYCTKKWHSLVSESLFTFSAKVLSKWCIHMFTFYWSCFGITCFWNLGVLQQLYPHHFWHRYSALTV